MIYRGATIYRYVFQLILNLAAVQPSPSYIFYHLEQDRIDG